MDKKILSQAAMLHEFSDKCRPNFNEDLFQRSEYDVAEALKNVILSCRRDGVFTIDVVSFEIIDGYTEVQKTLQSIETGRLSKSSKKDNPYDYIDIRETDAILLKVTYFIAIKNRQETLDVYIAIPKIIKKYYMRIAGNIYYGMFQIVDGSTYNNSTSASKKQSVTMKTMFQPMITYKNVNSLKSLGVDGVVEPLTAVNYAARIFNRTVPAMKYIFSKMGLYDGLQFLGVHHIYILNHRPDEDLLEEYFCFPKYDQFFILVPKFLYQNDHVTQSAVYTIHHSIIKDADFEEIFTNNYWKIVLGGEFANFTVDKADSILSSLENIYDIDTREDLRLPDDQKEDIYCVLRWMIREFPYLKMKDNLDISTKKVRYSSYMASFYAIKLSTGIYRISDLGKRANLDTIKKALNIHPMYLIKAMIKCKLVNYRNMSNDLDAITALKYTYKGVSGLGDNNSNSVPHIYRTVHPSHLGRVDIDSSSTSDPGVNGAICPLSELDNMSFSNYREPNFWGGQYGQLIDQYKRDHNLIDPVEVRKMGTSIISDNTTPQESAQCSNEESNSLIDVVIIRDRDKLTTGE